MCFDDECKNGHNTFSITAHVESPSSRRRNDWDVCGCLHDDIARVFPELAHFIKWHMCSTDGPLYYVTNTLYLAGDRDCFGRAKGEPSRFNSVIYFGTSPVHHKLSDKFAKFIGERALIGAVGAGFQVVAIAHEQKPSDTYRYAPKYTFAGFGEKWHECPFDDPQTAQEWAQALNNGEFRIDRIAVEWSEGKERELDKARRAGVWPDATDEQLSAPREELEAQLMTRLPALMQHMRADIEGAGFMWQCPETMADESTNS